MSRDDALRKAIADLTPGRLREILVALAACQSRDTRTGISLPAILSAVAGGVNLDEGPQGWRAQLALQRVIRETVKEIPGMRYIEGDS